MDSEELKSLGVLAFLLYRMGWYERSERVYAGLSALCAERSSARREALAGLAAAQIEQGKAREALENAEAAASGLPLSTRQAGLHLIRAQALWQLGRRTEAAAARDLYLNRAGPSARSARDEEGGLAAAKTK